jgi:5-methylthioadenosine/S-adenosylhomocysteine deaminase
VARNIGGADEHGSAPDQTSFVVRARHVLTCGPAGHIRDGAVAVAGGKIQAVAPYEDIRRSYPETTVMGDGTGIVSPGLISCHGHFSEGLVSGIGETHTLWEWFEHVVGPIEPFLTYEMAVVGTLLKGAEMAQSGVTTVGDMFCHAPGAVPSTPGVVKALDQLGLRGDVSFGPSSDPNPRPLDVIVAEHDALADAAASSRRSRFRVGIATVPSSSDELIQISVKLAADVGRLHIHLHEAREEVTHSRSTRGLAPVAYAARAGLLDAQVVAAHCVWVDQEDMRLLKEHDVAVAHNPVSNMILASGVCPVPRLRHEGISVGLGVDGAASNDSQNMLETMKMAALLQKLHHQQATAMTAPDVLSMATLGSATALGIDEEVGSLEPGKWADLVLFTEQSSSMANVHDPYQKVVYCASTRDVQDVWVAGERVVLDGHVVGVDMPELLPHARELAVRLATDAGLDSELAAPDRRGTAFQR